MAKLLLHGVLRGLRGIGVVAAIATTVGCSDDSSGGGSSAGGSGGGASGSGGSAGGGSGGTAGAGGNPGCNAAVAVPSPHIKKLDLEVNLERYAEQKYTIRQQVVLTSDTAGDAVTLFGTGLSLGKASHGYTYNGQRATFCVEPFSAGQDIALDITYEVDVTAQGLPAENIYGIQHWTGPANETVVGAYSPPYFSPLWLLAPQTPPWIDAAHDHNATVDAVELDAIVPDSSWTVVGPGAATVSDRSWQFSVSGRMPLFTLGFAASPHYTKVEPSAVSSKPEIFAHVLPASASKAVGNLNAARQAVDWMGTNVAPFPWSTSLTYAEVPRYPGGFEHTSAVWMGTIGWGGPGGDYTAIHEAVHHWWGNAVVIADWPHFWLSEGFADWTTVFEILETVNPTDAKARQHKFRADAATLSYPNKGPLRFADAGDFAQQLGNNGLFFYRYGASFLEMVDQRLQRDHNTKLITLLAKWFSQKRGALVTTEEFRDFLIAQTGASAVWTTLFDDWVFKTPCPTLELSDYQDSGTEVTMKVRRTGGANQSLMGVQIVAATNPPVSTSVSLPAGTTETVATLATTNVTSAIAVDPKGFYILRLNTASGWAGPAVTHALP